MKKILILCFSLLLLAGCWSDKTITPNIGNKTVEQSYSYQKQKDCIDYRNDYLKYLDKKLNLSDWDYVDDTNIFYSEIFDKCIASYEVISYDEKGTEFHEYHIDDIFEDKSLFFDSDFLLSESPDDYEEWIKELREHQEHYNKRNSQINKYRTWKTYEEERAEIDANIE